MMDEWSENENGYFACKSISGPMKYGLPTVHLNVDCYRSGDEFHASINEAYIGEANTLEEAQKMCDKGAIAFAMNILKHYGIQPMKLYDWSDYLSRRWVAAQAYALASSLEEARMKVDELTRYNLDDAFARDFALVAQTEMPSIYDQSHAHWSHGGEREGYKVEEVI